MQTEANVRFPFVGTTVPPGTDLFFQASNHLDQRGRKRVIAGFGVEVRTGYLQLGQDSESRLNSALPLKCHPSGGNCREILQLLEVYFD